MKKRVVRIATATLIMFVLNMACTVVMHTAWEMSPAAGPHSLLASQCCHMAHCDDGKCIKCDGSKKCQVCWGSGKNSSDNKCSICDGTGKCYYCSGTGKS
ncbi:MAG: hypothetical protein RDV48_24580 [Candidatus Eremiobacteraeota bacterium]|nr:hypothetical protein [Candidatus Eremiobacteraeota bacterium]